MSDTVKKIGIRQSDGTFLEKEIGVEANNIENFSSLEGTNISIDPVTNKINAVDTTYESKAASLGGDEVSLVTTGEKYIWNEKVSPGTTLSDYGIQNAYTKDEVDDLINETKTFYSQNLIAGQTSITFTNLPTQGNYISSFYTSNGISYISINNSISGQITVTYPPQSSGITVYLKLEEVIL